MKVGVLGLGIIGSRVAANYRAAGYEVSVWSRTPREVDGFTASPRAVAERADMIQIFVNDGRSLMDVLRNAEPALGDRHVIVNSATVSLADTMGAADLVIKKGAAFLDCPFTGSREAAGGGQLVYYVGDDADTLERVRPILERSSKEIIQLGKVGDATVLKIATNMVSATTVQALTEALAVTEAAGVSPELFVRAMESNASCSGLAKMKMPSMLRGDFAPHFSLKNMLKDSRFALELARVGGISIPALEVTSERMAAMAEAGHGDEDYSVLRMQKF